MFSFVGAISALNGGDDDDDEQPKRKEPGTKTEPIGAQPSKPQPRSGERRGLAIVCALITQSYTSKANSVRLANLATQTIEIEALDCLVAPISICQATAINACQRSTRPTDGLCEQPAQLIITGLSKSSLSPCLSRADQTKQERMTAQCFRGFEAQFNNKITLSRAMSY